MIVRNEEDRHLERVLKCWQEISLHSDARLMVTDDASTDGTVAMCLEYGAEVQESPEPLFWKHEGQARQRHYDFTTRKAQVGDWVLSIDADETISRPDLLPEFTRLADRQEFGAIGLPLLEFWTDDEYRIDGFWIGTKTPRLYRWRAGGQIRQAEMGCGSEPTYVHSVSVLTQDRVRLLHWGYVREEDRVRKHAAYSERLGGHGHSNTHVDSIVTVPMLESYQEDLP
jgi:glycosyltransferase involved in cell wall biosynthesis